MQQTAGGCCVEDQMQKLGDCDRSTQRAASSLPGSPSGSQSFCRGVSYAALAQCIHWRCMAPSPLALSAVLPHASCILRGPRPELQISTCLHAHASDSQLPPCTCLIQHAARWCTNCNLKLQSALLKMGPTSFQSVQASQVPIPTAVNVSI